MSLQTKRSIWLGLGIFLLLTSSQPQSPHFVNHPEQELTLNFEAFKDAGCPPDQYGFDVCSSNSPLAKLECDEIQEPSKLLAALNPSYPIAMCLIEPDRNIHSSGQTETQMLAEGEYFYIMGGISLVFVRYVIWHDGKFQLIKVKDEFRRLYAPIESGDEALSYALAMTNLSAYYGLERKPTYVYFTDTVEDTYVKKLADGYLIHLYDYIQFGCAPHITSAVDIKVSIQGKVEQISKEPMYKDPTEDGLCID